MLIHYSGKPLTSVYSVAQSLEHDRFKPAGLWVSAGDGDDGWRAWCQSEQFDLERFALATEVVLAPDANVLRLSTASELDDFTRDYRNVPMDGISDRLRAIDWRKVAAKYQGIIIAPYIWDRRMTLMWYYTWDCASGCIWDAAAVAELRPMRLTEAA